MKTIFAIILLLTCMSLYADHQDFESDEIAYRTGYLEGYEHGYYDQRARVNFNFTHANEYQTDRSYDRTLNCQFKVGYAEGYADGYFRGPARFSDSQHNYGSNSPGGYNTPGYNPPGGYNTPGYNPPGGYNTPGYNSGYNPRGGSAVAFSETGFSGSAREFPIGRYAYLDNGWDDVIESIQTRGNVRVILFDMRNFQGLRQVVENDAPDLRSFRKKAASMIVEPIGLPYRR